jgi:hypothetical protein
LRQLGSCKKKCRRPDHACYLAGMDRRSCVMRPTQPGLPLQPRMSQELLIKPRPVRLPARSTPQELHPVVIARPRQWVDLGAPRKLFAVRDPMEHQAGAGHPRVRPTALRPRQAPGAGGDLGDPT